MANKKSDWLGPKAANNKRLTAQLAGGIVLFSQNPPVWLIVQTDGWKNPVPVFQGSYRNVMNRREEVNFRWLLLLLLLLLRLSICPR